MPHLIAWVGPLDFCRTTEVAATSDVTGRLLADQAGATIRVQLRADNEYLTAAGQATAILLPTQSSLGQFGCISLLGIFSPHNASEGERAGTALLRFTSARLPGLADTRLPSHAYTLELHHRLRLVRL